MTAYAPLAQGRAANDPVLASIGQKYGVRRSNKRLVNDVPYSSMNGLKSHRCPWSLTDAPGTAGRALAELHGKGDLSALLLTATHALGGWRRLIGIDSGVSVRTPSLMGLSQPDVTCCAYA
jgi:hypothetical protein